MEKPEGAKKEEGSAISDNEWKGGSLWEWKREKERAATSNQITYNESIMTVSRPLPGTARWHLRRRSGSGTDEERHQIKWLIKGMDEECEKMLRN